MSSTLDKRYDISTNADLARLKKKFLDLKIGRGQNALSWLADVRQLYDRLSKAGIQPSIAGVHAVVPPQLIGVEGVQVIAAHWITQEDPSRTLDDMISAVESALSAMDYNETQQKVFSQTEKKDMERFFLQKGWKRPNPTQKKRFGVKKDFKFKNKFQGKCYNCGIIGHKIS